MRLFNLLAASLLSVAAVAAKQTGEDKFQDYHSKLQSKNVPLKLTDESYSQMTVAPRNYSAAVLLTALESRFGCDLCHQFDPEWNTLVRSWTKGDKEGESKTVFGTLDFADGKATFQGLMVQSVPMLLLFPPTEGPNAARDTQLKKLDFGPGHQNADTVHQWLTRQLPNGPHPPVIRQLNYFRIVTTAVGVLGVITLLVVVAPYLLPIIQNRNLWAGISLIAVLLFTSGHMFNHIRRVPYVANGQGGKVSYFAGGFQNQFGLETQIIAAIYGVLAFATISLALKVPRIADPKKQQIAVVIYGCVMLGTYSFLISIFKIKNGSYPFWLPPF